jgi:hypothetical protein
MSIASNIGNSLIFNRFIPTTQSPSIIAQSILADTAIGKTAHNIEKIAVQLEQFAQNDPSKAVAIKAEVIKALSPTERGELSSVIEKGVQGDAKKDDCVNRSYIPGIMVKPSEIGIWFPDSYFNLKDYYTISAHGNELGVRGPNFAPTTNDVTEARLLLEDIEAHGWDRKKPIILLVCNVGKGQLPSELAKQAGVPVYAATGFVSGSVGAVTARQDVIHENGEPLGGKFEQFNPDGTKQNPFNIKNQYAVVGLERTFTGGLKPITVPIAVLEASLKK